MSTDGNGGLLLKLSCWSHVNARSTARRLSLEAASECQCPMAGFQGTLYLHGCSIISVGPARKWAAVSRLSCCGHVNACSTARSLKVPAPHGWTSGRAVLAQVLHHLGAPGQEVRGRVEPSGVETAIPTRR